LIFHEAQQRFVRDPLRTSEAAGFPFVSEWPAVHALNRRMAAASGTDVRQGETLQVLRYARGQEYRPHLDAIPALANQRVLTFLVYLNDDYGGGETDFPELGLHIRGEAGMGLLFANALPDGRPDPRMRHAGLPVRSGSKLLASRWIRARLPEHPDGFGSHEAERQ
jgi:prolyl 4-hydroxylase